MDNQKQELIQKLKDADNVLVTVSANPSVDQLAACIGLTLLLNKLKKHATAVFSGEVPSTLQFLKPEETLEKNTDSLRDFIVSLDKAKADKLRYKVEDNVVKIFITPYKTPITEADLEFSQGDFNIDAVVCLGIDKQADLDQAIVAHGRILHDATVISVNIGQAGELGTLNWVEPQASSLSELTAQIADSIGREEIDGQIATSFLTGIVAETERFSNEKTTPVVMQLAALLMAAGANQQLVVSELQAADASLAIAAPDESAPSSNSNDGTLEVGHSADVPDDEEDSDTSNDDAPAEEPASRLVLQPPSLGGQLTANSEPESFDPSVDPLSLLDHDTPMLTRADTPQTDEPNIALPPVAPVTDEPTTEDNLPDFEALASEPASTAPADDTDDNTEKSLADLEEAVNSPHVQSGDLPSVDVDTARDAVLAAAGDDTSNSLPEPTEASGAEGYLDVQDIPDSTQEPITAATAGDDTSNLTIPTVDPTPPTSVSDTPSTAPPVPPPLPLDPTQFSQPKPSK